MSSDEPRTASRIAAVIGGGPAGLIAAEMLAAARAGLEVVVFDRMPTLGRKFLMAGRGGLNLTHSEPLGRFLARYREAAPMLSAAIEAFPPDALRAWCEGLGQPTFIGTSGRVFPKAMKASPLLRAWRTRLVSLGVRFALRQRWTGWDESGALCFEGAGGAITTVRPAACGSGPAMASTTSLPTMPSATLASVMPTWHTPRCSSRCARAPPPASSRARHPSRRAPPRATREP